MYIIAGSNLAGKRICGQSAGFSRVHSSKSRNHKTAVHAVSVRVTEAQSEDGD